MSKRFFELDLTPRENPDYVFVHSRPDGMGAEDYRLGKGESTKGVYPKDARIYMDDDERGLELPSFIGNTSSMVLVEHAVKDAIEQLCGHKGYEYLPVSIYNHKKRLASADYFIINPIGTFDCLHKQKSEVDYFNGKVVSVDKKVLDSKKVKNAPYLFRLKEEPQCYLASEDFVKHLIALRPRPTNFSFLEIEVA
jgi:hypothetical protein